MKTLLIVLSVINILNAIAIVYLVVQQDENDQGLGTLSGSNNTSYYGANKSKSKDAVLRKVTTILAIIFVVINIAIGLIMG